MVTVKTTTSIHLLITCLMAQALLIGDATGVCLRNSDCASNELCIRSHIDCTCNHTSTSANDTHLCSAIADENGEPDDDGEGKIGLIWIIVISSMVLISILFIACSIFKTTSMIITYRRMTEEERYAIDMYKNSHDSTHPLPTIRPTPTSSLVCLPPASPGCTSPIKLPVTFPVTSLYNNATITRNHSTVADRGTRNAAVATSTPSLNRASQMGHFTLRSSAPISPNNLFGPRVVYSNITTILSRNLPINAPAILTLKSPRNATDIHTTSVPNSSTATFRLNSPRSDALNL